VDRTHGERLDLAVTDSISKTPIADEVAARIVERAAPGRTLASLSPCPDGWFNAVYRLAIDDGSSCVLKVAPPPQVRVMRYEHDLITTEVDTLRRLGRDTDLPVPEVLFWDPSCELVPSPYFLMSPCPGVALDKVRADLAPDVSRSVDAQLARFVATVNSIRADTFGRPEPSAPRHASWAAAFGQLIEDLLADAADADVSLPCPLDDIAALVARHHDALEAVTEPRLVHWDLWDSNVFVDPESFEVVGVIDFERVLWGDPLMEAQFVGRRARDEVVDAYGTALFDQPGAVERRRLYDLYLYLVMTIECAYRHYPTDDIENLARALLPLVLDEIG
jgi:aminoglycoside phosphotransferase (APT) family kinase protein